MTKQELKRKHPQEQLLMFDCPNCGQEVNKKFVEKIIDDIEQAVREEMIESEIERLKNNKHSEPMGDEFYGRYNQALDDQISHLQSIKKLTK